MKNIIIAILWLVPIISLCVSIVAGITLYISLYNYRKNKILQQKK